MAAGARRWRAAGVSTALLGAALVAASAVPASGSNAGPPTTGTPLAQDIDRILGDARLNGTHVGVVVRKETDGTLLYDRGGDDRELPASTGKLLTSTAALDVLGPDYRFTTTVLADGPRHGAAEVGNLYLRGTGDPTLTPADLDRLAAQVAATGVRQVTGKLVADDTWFDGTHLGPGWMWDDEPYYYAAPVTALTLSPDADFDAGTVLVRATPTTPGQPAIVQLDPPTDTHRIVNQVTTGPPGSVQSYDVERQHGTDTILVTGSIPADGPPAVDLSSVDNPTTYTADVFRKALARHGVQVHDPATAVGATPAAAQPLATRDSMTLRELLVPFLKLSNNEHAEILTKAMGRKESGQGSWDAGLAAMRGALGGLGVSASALRMVDGSGLSTMDSVPPVELTNLLRTARQKPWFDPWYQALPIAGVADRMIGGTLRHRMAGTRAAGNLHGKTGSMTGVDALSGYVTAADGERLVFSVVFNNFLGGGPRDLEDAIAVRLADYQGPADTSHPAESTPKSDSTPDARNLECTWSHTC